MNDTDFEAVTVVREGRRITVYVRDTYRLTTYHYEYKANPRDEVKRTGGGSFKDRERWREGNAFADEILRDRGFTVVPEDEWLFAPWIPEHGMSSIGDLKDYLDELDAEGLQAVDEYVTAIRNQTGDVDD